MAAMLTLDDIADLRAYERERDAFRSHVIELKKRRRVGLGPIATLLFENRDTVRFQIQEMARVERIITDEAIQHELDTYNPLVPGPGQLAATLFLELVSEAELRHWLPRLVGIETALELRPSHGDPVPCLVDEGHAATLTRDEVTASVHYVHWQLRPEQVEAFAAGPVVLASVHPAYPHEVTLPEATHRELLVDLRG